MFLLLFSKCVIAQNAILGSESFNWFFGENAGLTFNTIDGKPKAIKGELVTEEGCATVSDDEGNLLFYASGTTVWNRLHQVMKGGDNMPGGFSSTQAVLILQQPGVNGIFYVFNTVNFGGRFTYSIVSLADDKGLGEVISKGNFIADSIGEKLTAVYHRNKRDVWIVVKERYSHAFRSYLLTETGIHFPPVRSEIPLDFSLAEKCSAMGFLMFSPIGNKLAAASYSGSQFEIYHFDRFSGEVSNPIVLKIPEKLSAYGVCFSPDGSKLYGTYFDYDAYLVQYDLSKYDEATIAASEKTIAEFHDGLSIAAIQVGPDGRLYVSRYKSNYLSTINAPNRIGNACDFIENSIYLDGARTRLGLPNFTYVNNYYKSTPDPKYYNILFKVQNIQGQPGDSSRKIVITAKMLNDTDKVDNLSLTAILSFSASAYSLVPNASVLSEKIKYGKRIITFQLNNLNITSEEKIVAELPGTILLSDKKMNKLSLSVVNLNNPQYRIFCKSGYLIIREVCQNNLRKVTTSKMILNIKQEPVAHYLSFDYITSVGGDYQCNIYSLNGKLIYTDNSSYFNENTKVEKSIALTGINAGLYILAVKTPVKQLIRLFIKN